MSRQFTPGPWTIAGRGYTVFGPDGMVVLSSFDAETEEEEERYIANARLVAAAPDLYEALETLLDRIRPIWTTLVGDDPAQDKALAALAKARGEG